MIYPEQAKYPSNLFPVGSRPLVRLYRGRTPDNMFQGKLLAEGHGTISKKGIKLPEMKIPTETNPATGAIIRMDDLSYWLVDSEGNEHFLAKASLG